MMDGCNKHGNTLCEAIKRSETRANEIIEKQGFIVESDVLGILYEELGMPSFYDGKWAQAK